ncbi:MAG TPA: hypothetical protein PLJ36_01955, partial [Ruminococcus bromii]|nr:hypothetical protein [Ruminococcus bromii]
QTEEILKKELTEKYFKIKECLSRSGNFISELSNKKDVENLLYYFFDIVCSVPFTPKNRSFTPRYIYFRL